MGRLEALVSPALDWLDPGGSNVELEVNPAGFLRSSNHGGEGDIYYFLQLRSCRISRDKGRLQLLQRRLELPLL